MNSGNEIEQDVADSGFANTTPEKEAEIDRLIAEQEEKFKAADLTPEQIDAGLASLAGGIATAQEVENAARSEEGLDPIDQPLPLDFGPFNSDAALKSIFEKSAEVRVLQADYDDKKEAAKDAKSELDIASKALVNIIESLKNRRSQALNPTQPYLREVGDTARSACPWEREHPGQSCPICTAANAKGIVPALESAVHPEHEEHEQTADAAQALQLAPLADALKARNLYAGVDDLQALTADELSALTAWNAEPGPIPPQILTRCCIAAAPGSLIQVCKRCDMRLADDTDLADAGFNWYPVDALVGFDCAGMTFAEHAKTLKTDAPAAEPARTLPKRGTKARAKKQPEAEREQQTAAGKKATRSKKGRK